ncbi:hypothetical protein [Cypionkella sp.]|uniref:hypothetical protein n=1 Tax=Cypionkella sp. TaxID=2811411 RepID=UPI002771CB1D|nr:hypothetical protein [Cypionkella sp.]
MTKIAAISCHPRLVRGQNRLKVGKILGIGLGTQTLGRNTCRQRAVRQDKASLGMFHFRKAGTALFFYQMVNFDFCQIYYPENPLLKSWAFFLPPA